jgi:Methyltransferase domain
LDRFQELTKYVTKNKLGIEIGPWHSPIAPKREGYNCLVLDVFDTKTLRTKAKGDPLIARRADNIEEVDLLGSSTEIGDLVEKQGLTGEVDYVLSSHNFEHLANPIRFLEGCEKTLKPGGVLSMIIPDRRTCFDYFRPHTTLAAWLEAYFARRESPTWRQVFEHQSLHSLYQRGQEPALCFSLSDDPARIVPIPSLREAFEFWKSRLQLRDGDYCDAHCSAFTPASFELLLSDLVFLGLTQLQLIEISETRGCEFFVHLRRPATAPKAPDPDAFYAARAALLHRVSDEAGANSIEAFRVRSDLNRALDKIVEQQREIEEANKDAQNFRHASHQRIKELEAVIEGLLRSKSWRLTSPIRAIAAAMRR